MKVCSKCKKLKTLDSFGKDNRGCGDGFVAKCKDCVNAYSAKWREDNPRHCYEWQKNHPEQMAAYKRDNRIKSLNYYIRELLRSRLWGAIKNNQKAGSAVLDLGCTIPELKEYLQKLFQPGMNWDNQGRKGWHIDHIIPLCSFDLTNREQFLKAVHYTNLQPLWWYDNLTKMDNQVNTIAIK